MANQLCGPVRGRLKQKLQIMYAVSSKPRVGGWGGGLASECFLRNLERLGAEVAL